MEEFSLRCRCGALIHSSTEHVGRTIRCRCGESLRIERPRSSRKKKTRRGSRTIRWFRACTVEFYSYRAVTRWTARLQLAYLIGVAATWIALITTSERWLPATLLTYGPRAVVLLPLALLVPAGLLFARRTLLLSALGAALAVSQIMGFRVSLGPAEAPARLAAPGSSAVRIVTLNVAGQTDLAFVLFGLIERLEPDVISFQECPPDLAEKIVVRPDWHYAVHHSLCTISRWPLGEPDSMPRADFERGRSLGFGGSALAVRFRVSHPVRAFDVVNLHLETARKGLEGLIGADGLIPNSGVLTAVPFSQNSAQLDANARVRAAESDRASRWAARDTQTVAVVVTGDFNLPVESTIYRTSWRGYLNAFEEKGRGFGYSKNEGRLLRIRIDHVLASANGFRVEGAWLGGNVGSDHRPVVADLVMNAP